jgi:protease-4
MKQFFKMMLATIAGMLVVTVIGTLIFAGMISAMMSFGNKIPEVADNSVLKIALDKPVEDRISENPLSYIDAGSLSLNIPLGLNKILNGIEKAKYDARIKGIYLDLSDVKAGFATVEEIRNAIADFKEESGKFVIAYAEEYSQKAYYLATVADKVYMNPYGNFTLTGLRSEIMTFKGLLDKLGVEMQIIRHGKFKAAVEPFMMKDISSENRAQIMAYIGSIWNSILQTISEARNISVDDLNAIADKLTLVVAQDAVDKNLVDKLLYKDELLAELCKYTGAKSEKQLKSIGISDYTMAPKKATKYSRNKIAVIYASGEIMRGEDDSNLMSVNMSNAIRQARTDTAVKAIVFRVNSPGGDAQASEIIARELELAQKAKPVIVSMGEVAASGGYWISTPGEVIMANQTTITGSIGVFGMIPNVQKGLSEKLGISVNTVETNKYSGFPSIYRPLQAAEREYLQKIIEDIYSKFINKVSTFRDITIAEVDSLGQGRVWSGSNAVNNGLIDRFGGLQDAIALAVEKAGVENDYRIIELPKEDSPLGRMFSLMGARIKGKSNIGNELEYAMKHYEYIMNAINHRGIMARMSYNVELY